MAGPTDPRPFASPSPGVGRLSHWQIGWLLAFEDTPGIDAHKAIQLRQDVAVCHQTASASEVAQVVDGRYAMACCQRNNVVASVLRPVFIRGARTDSSFVIFALKCIIKYLVDSWVQGIVRMAVIANINRDRNVAMDVTFVAPLPKSHVSLLSDDVTFPT